MIERFVVNGKEFILIGTAHVSRESVTEVQQVIESESPHAVAVELDADRLNQLLQGEKFRDTNVMDLIKAGQTHLFLFNLLLANLQRKIGQDLGVKPGEEMLAAVQKAQEKQLPVILADRPVKITLSRTLSALTLVEKLKIAGNIFMGVFTPAEPISKEKIESMKDQDAVTQLVQELSREAPNAKKSLIDERDAFISHSLLEAPYQKIVAVVGAGHVQGIKARLLANERADLAELLKVSEKKSIWGIILPWVIPVLFIALFASVFLGKGFDESLAFLGYWIVITGTCSAIGALAARSHPLSILTAFIAAPFTTLHPALASGWFAAGVESKFKSPKVRDFEGLSALNSYSDFEKNNVTHLLLVAALTNLGTMIGVLIAFPYLIHFLA